MFSNGTVIIGTGDDDLREGSLVWVRIYLRDRPPLVFEAANGMRFPDRTDTAAIPWSLASSHHPPVPTEDVEHIEVSFVPNRRELMEDDKWWFTKLVVAVNDTITGLTELYRNESIGRKFDRAGTWSSGILPTYSAVGSTLVRVSDDFGGRVPDAEVFIRSNFVGVTDTGGELLVPTSLLAMTPEAVDIVVRKRIHEQNYYRSNHNFDSSQNWNFRVYHTNVSIADSGIATPEWGPFGSVVDITVHRDNTLIGLNLLVSVEWDLSLTDLAALEDKINDCSAFLYNATDGQFFVEVAQITDRRDLWDDSDYRVFADWNYGANVPQVRGAFLGQNVLGSAMKMSRGNGGKVYAHEFGHYGLALGDEYKNGDSPTVCTEHVMDSMSAFGRGQNRASCIMWNEHAVSKICSSFSANPHVRGTRQGDEACWDTIVRRYNIDSRWNIRTPSDRGAVPGMIRYTGGSSSLRAAFMMPKIHRRLRPDRHGLIGELTLTVSEQGGVPVTGVVVKTREASGSWLVQGTTDEFGIRTLAGVHAGDRLRLEVGSDTAFERDIPRVSHGSLSVEIPV